MLRDHFRLEPGFRWSSPSLEGIPPRVFWTRLRPGGRRSDVLLLVSHEQGEHPRPEAECSA